MAEQSTLARPYARAVFDIARGSSALAAWSDGLAAAAAVVANDTAKAWLSQPGRTADERATFVASLCETLPSASVLGMTEGRNLLKLLAENDRLFVLPEISAQFDALRTAAENKIRVTVVSATQAEADVTAKIAQALTKRFGREVELELEVDASLLGGAIVRADDRVIDGSVKSRLQRLAGTLVD